MRVPDYLMPIFDCELWRVSGPLSLAQLAPGFSLDTSPPSWIIPLSSRRPFVSLFENPAMSILQQIARRDFLKLGLGAFGLSLPAYLGLQAQKHPHHRGGPRSCIVLYCWGGMSHHETWDTKPDAPPEYRGEFQPIATAVPGIRIGEHMPRLAQHTDKLAIIRSMNHRSSAHGKGMYWNFTGHPPPEPEVPINIPPTRQDWPSIGSMVAKFRRAPAGLPNTVQLPYQMVDNNTFQAGESAGFLGLSYDPVIVRPDRGRPWGGVSRDLGHAWFCRRADGVDSNRLDRRVSSCARAVDQRFRLAETASYDPAFASKRPTSCSARRCKRRSISISNRPASATAMAITCAAKVCCWRGVSPRPACRSSRSSARPGISTAPAATCGTRTATISIRLKNDLLPPFDRARQRPLLRDLAERGRLDDTLVVFMTEFGRTPRVNGSAGRDHYPLVYSMALAGGGIRGGQVYGSSDRLGAEPRDLPTGPADVHATIFHTLGIPLDAHLTDSSGRSFPLGDGRVLPLF